MVGTEAELVEGAGTHVLEDDVDAAHVVLEPRDR
jgi:hypothetical protein